MNQEIDIFRVGRWRDKSGDTREWTKDDLEQIADSCSADNPAPVVIGHPKENSPAYGWIDGEDFAAINEACADFFPAGFLK